VHPGEEKRAHVLTGDRATAARARGIDLTVFDADLDKEGQAPLGEKDAVERCISDLGVTDRALAVQGLGLCINRGLELGAYLLFAQGIELLAVTLY
jgi:hypothetical protein